MGRSGFVGFRVVPLIIIILLSGLVGCSSSNPVKTTVYPVPTSVAIVPTPYMSLDIGTNQGLSATPLSAAKAVIAEPVTYQSSNTAVVTVAANGLANQPADLHPRNRGRRSGHSECTGSQQPSNHHLRSSAHR